MRIKIKLIYFMPFSIKCIHELFHNINRVFDDRKIIVSQYTSKSNPFY